MKILKKTTFKDFFYVNEVVAKTSPMRTHYFSSNPVERWLWKQKKITIQKLLKNLNIKSLVDLGCGDGGMLSVIENQVKYTGIDISPTQIAAAKNFAKKIRKNNTEIKVGDITDLKIPNNTFDAALICDAAEHVIDLHKLFYETKRIVKNNGYIIISIPNEFLWEFSRALLLRFPLRSPDHLKAIFPSDIEQNFSRVLKKVFLPVSFSSKLSLIHVFLIQNDK